MSDKQPDAPAAPDAPEEVEAAPKVVLQPGQVRPPSLEAVEGMVEITIVTACNYRMMNGEILQLPVGKYWVDQEVADSWFVQHHSDDPPDIALTPGTPQWADAERKRRARTNLLNAAITQAADDAKQEGKAKAEAATAVHPDGQQDPAPDPNAPPNPRPRSVKKAAPPDEPT